MIVGVTGRSASGKDTVANFFVEKGFKRLSLSDEIRKVLEEEGTEVNRKNLINKANELRREQGLGILAKRAVDKIENRNHVIISIRNPGEVEELRKLDGFVLICVQTPDEKRSGFVKERGENWEEFKYFDEKEFQSNDPAEQQLKQTIESADKTIINDGSLEDLKTKFEELYDNLI